MRVLWNTVAFILFEYSPKPAHKWRSLLLRCFGAKVGKNAHIYPKVKVWAPWNLEVGESCGIANGVILYSQGKISIGKKSVISQGAHICAGTHDYTHSGFPLITKPIIIGDNCWVAAEAFVHPGVTINSGSVIGARSVVTKDMPAWSICTGFPCKPIRERVLIDDVVTNKFSTLIIPNK